MPTPQFNANGITYDITINYTLYKRARFEYSSSVVKNNQFLAILFMRGKNEIGKRVQ